MSCSYSGEEPLINSQYRVFGDWLTCRYLHVNMSSQKYDQLLCFDIGDFRHH